MSKGLILKIILCGFVVFLLLPAVFDEEQAKPVKKQPFEDATEFNPSLYDGEESLPILDIAEPEEANVFTRYAKKFKNMYGRALFGRNDEKTPSYKTAQTDEYGDEELYYAMAALFSAGNSEKGGAEQRASYDSGNSKGGANINAVAYDKEYFSGVPSTVKQTVHENAPVKGLYETSAVESYETRSKAQQVYSNVMNKVDRTVPKAARAKALGEVSSAGTEDTESYQGGSYGAFDQAAAADIGYDDRMPDLNDSMMFAAASTKKNNSKYSGIASRSSSRSGGNYGSGSYSAYSRNSVGSLEDLGGGFGDSFEALLSRTQGSISTAADIMKEERREREENESKGQGGGNQSGNDKESVPSQSGNLEGLPNDNGQSGGNEGSAVAGGDEETVPGDEAGEKDGAQNGGQTQEGGKKPGQDNPPLGQDTVFDQQKYDYVLHDTCVDGPNSDRSANTQLPFTEEIASFNSRKGILSPSSASNPDKIEPFCSTPLEGAQPIEAAIEGKNIVVDLGLTKGNDGNLYRVTPTYMSLSDKGLSQIGIEDYYEGSRNSISLGELFKGTRISEFAAAANNKNSIVITVSPAVARAYLGKSVLIEEGDLESKSGLRSLSEKLNNLPAERERILAVTSQQQAARSPQPQGRSQAQEQARKEAAAKADIQEKKEEIKEKGFFGRIFDNLRGGNNTKRK